MAAKSIPSSSQQSSSPSNILTWLFGLVSFGLLLFLIFQLTLQIATPTPHSRLVFVNDVPLPSVLPNDRMPFPGTPSPRLGPLSPGVAVRFDHFDFQSLDPTTGLLFIAHTGPAPDKEALVNPTHFVKDKDAGFDGHCLVYDTT